MLDILMSETCWSHRKWNKIASDIKLVFHSSTITMMHGPINIRYTHLIFSNIFVENRAVYDMRQKNIVEFDRPQMVIWRMRLSWWIPRDKNTHSEYVILIIFPLQQQLHECTSVLRYACIACLVVCKVQLQSKAMLVTVLYGRLFSVCKNICRNCEGCSTKLIYRPVQKRGVKAGLTGS